MKILVTGACGVLGAAVLRMGLEDGCTLSIITNSLLPSSYANHAKEKLTVHRRPGDLLDIKHLIQDQDVVINLDGCSSSAPSQEEERYLRNVRWPQELYGLLTEKQLFIHCSTNATLCSGTSVGPASEKNWGEARQTPYALSKLRFDQWLEKNQRLPTLVLHPGYILGDWDAGPSSGAIFLRLSMGQVTGFVNRTKNFVSSTDLARFILRSAKRRLTGRYVVGGVNLEIKDFLSQASGLLDFQLPVEVGSVEMLDEFMKEFCLTGALDSEKARAAGLGITVSLDQMIEESLKGFERRRLLKKRIR